MCLSVLSKQKCLSLVKMKEGSAVSLLLHFKNNPVITLSKSRKGTKSIPFQNSFLPNCISYGFEICINHSLEYVLISFHFYPFSQKRKTIILSKQSNSYYCFDFLHTQEEFQDLFQVSWRAQPLESCLLPDQTSVRLQMFSSPNHPSVYCKYLIIFCILIFIYYPIQIR